ncbi:MAG: hypothetical protein ACREMD_01765 [Gemmatimonadota bacterium]
MPHSISGASLASGSKVWDRTPPEAIRVGALLLLFASLSVVEARAQQCLGRPVESGEQALAVRLELEEVSMLLGEYSGVSGSFGWSAVAGAAGRELVPPQEIRLALGGGTAWTGLHRAFCPAISFRTWADDSPVIEGESTRQTRIGLGIGVGRRLGEDRIRGAAFLFPHLRIVREDLEFQGEEIDDSRGEWWIDGGFSLRGQRLWGMAILGLQFGGYSPGEDIIDGSLKFAAGVAF